MTTDPQRKGLTDPRPIRRTDVTVHELDGEALVFDATSCDTHRLNDTALFIWHRCDGRQDARRVAEQLAGAYDISPDSAFEHVERMFGEFQARRLVVTAD